MCSTTGNSEYEIPPSAPSELPMLCYGDFAYSWIGKTDTN